MFEIVAVRLWVQGDNTVKELKNQLSGQLLSMLIASGFINEGGHHHLPIGHTHEDIGSALNFYNHLSHCMLYIPCCYFVLCLAFIIWPRCPVRTPDPHVGSYWRPTSNAKRLQKVWGSFGFGHVYAHVADFFKVLCHAISYH